MLVEEIMVSLRLEVYHCGYVVPTEHGLHQQHLSVFYEHMDFIGCTCAHKFSSSGSGQKEERKNNALLHYLYHTMS